MSNSKSGLFIKELVIGWGFLSGLWIYAGVDPEAVVIGAFANVLQELGSPYGWILWLLPIASTIGSAITAWVMGGSLGIISIVLAFLGGIFIGSFGIWLLIGGMILAFFAVRD